MRTERNFPNGFEAWKETYFEVVAHLMTTTAYSGSMSREYYEDGGRGAMWTLAEQLTDEFEKEHQQDFEEGWITLDYFEAVDDFLTEKEREHRKNL